MSLTHWNGFRDQVWPDAGPDITSFILSLSATSVLVVFAVVVAIGLVFIGLVVVIVLGAFMYAKPRYTRVPTKAGARVCRDPGIFGSRIWCWLPQGTGSTTKWS